MANVKGCWNWFDTDNGRAQGEAGLIMNAIDQVCLLHRVDRARVAVAGLRPAPAWPRCWPRGTQSASGRW